MDDYREKASSRTSIASVIGSSSINRKLRARESVIQQDNGLNIEQKHEKIRIRLLRLLLTNEYDSTTNVPAIVPLRPMPYVRRFSVPNSLKKSRSSGFFF
jgi:hypothetical protein